MSEESGQTVKNSTLMEAFGDDECEMYRRGFINKSTM
jgi:hypothetical protein